ncbi:MAG: hypothetical protein EOP85_04360 [Verrucomicrobiaceae bacterium]|nr:MAG: hypothetical protein EOP85_04360 [Verrucomicrobiaceae bacterium]
MGSSWMTKRLRLLILLLSCTFLASPVNAAVEVGNFVWEDLDKDGIQDSGEPGVRGATVQLWNSAVTLLAGSAVTDAAGRYQMTVPDNAQYRMRVILPYAGDRFTLANVGSDSTDSDIVPGSTNIGLSGVYTFAAGRTTAQTLDAGVISDPMKDHNIGDYVFKPEVNGLQGSWSVNNATVELMNAAGTVLQTTTSNVDGHYSFKAPPGTYRMRFTHSLYRPSPWKDQGSDDTVDSDIDEDGYTDLFTVTGSTVRKDIDAGFVQDLLIGNFVWEDLDRDGVQDLGEPGLEGIPLELWNATRTRRFDTTTSGPDGEYRLIAPGGDPPLPRRHVQPEECGDTDRERQRHQSQRGQCRLHGHPLLCYQRPLRHPSGCGRHFGSDEGP